MSQEEIKQMINAVLLSMEIYKKNYKILVTPISNNSL